MRTQFNIPLLVSAYTIELPIKRTQKKDVVEIILRPRVRFFNQKMSCHYDFRTRQIICRDLDKKYQVLSYLNEAPNEKYGVICASLGFLCSKKICLHFPYCYGELSDRHTGHIVLLEKMNFTFQHIFDTRPKNPSIQPKLNPFFLASILFQIM